MNGSDGNFWAIMTIVRKGDKSYIHTLHTHIYIYNYIYIHISMVLGALFSYEPT